MNSYSRHVEVCLLVSIDMHARHEMIIIYMGGIAVTYNITSFIFYLT